MTQESGHDGSFFQRTFREGDVFAEPDGETIRRGKILDTIVSRARDAISSGAKPLSDELAFRMFPFMIANFDVDPRELLTKSRLPLLASSFYATLLSLDSATNPAFRTCLVFKDYPQALEAIYPELVRYLPKTKE